VTEMKAIAACLLCCGATLLGALGLIETQETSETQRIILAEYLSIYCTKDGRHDPMFVIGSEAAISRIVVKANIGALALLEYAKCKAGLDAAADLTNPR
jgi:hypothetical protein